jgi:hypothetical protein
MTHLEEDKRTPPFSPLAAAEDLLKISVDTISSFGGKTITAYRSTSSGCLINPKFYNDLGPTTDATGSLVTTAVSFVTVPGTRNVALTRIKIPVKVRVQNFARAVPELCTEAAGNDTRCR